LHGEGCQGAGGEVNRKSDPICQQHKILVIREEKQREQLCSKGKSRSGERGANQMKDKEILRDLSEEILVDMDNWQRSNPDATLLEIEEKSRELVSK